MFHEWNEEEGGGRVGINPHTTCKGKIPLYSYLTLPTSRINERCLNEKVAYEVSCFTRT
jgi:hypothetical protein